MGALVSIKKVKIRSIYSVAFQLLLVTAAGLSSFKKHMVFLSS